VAKRETREALIAAALAEFVAHGIDVPSLDAICARAGYTRGAFYVHFRDRDDLLAAVVEHVLGAFIDTVIASGDEAHDLERTVDRFAGAVRVALSATAVDPTLPLPPAVPFARLLDAISRSRKLRERFATLLRRALARLTEVAAHGQAARGVRRDVEPGQLAFLLLTIALGVVVAIDAGLEVDVAGARGAVLRLLAPAGARP
jgi:AcrR family transcriptional regulator